MFISGHIQDRSWSSNVTDEGMGYIQYTIYIIHHVVLQNNSTDFETNNVAFKYMFTVTFQNVHFELNSVGKTAHFSIYMH